MSLSVAASPEAPASKPTLWAGRLLTALPVVFLLLDGVAKVMQVAPVMEACAQLEIPARVIPGLGALLIAATLLYAFPPTSLLGAVGLTGYLGGAIWTHVRIGGPAFPVAFPGLVAAMVWADCTCASPACGRSSRSGDRAAHMEEKRR